jgi:hypothetical protein
MAESQPHIRQLADLDDEDVREAITSAMRDCGLGDEHILAAEVSLGATGYDESGDESGAAPWASRSWQSIEVRVGPHLFTGNVTHVEQAADGKASSWVEASLTPTEKA